MENLQIPNVRSDKKHKEHRRSLSLEGFERKSRKNSIVNQRINFFTNLQTLYTRSASHITNFESKDGTFIYFFSLVIKYLDIFTDVYIFRKWIELAKQGVYLKCFIHDVMPHLATSPLTLRRKANLGTETKKKRNKVNLFF